MLEIEMIIIYPYLKMVPESFLEGISFIQLKDGMVIEFKMVAIGIVNKITMTASLMAVLFVQEQLLTFIPNFQLTFLLLILITRIFGGKIGSIVIILHVLLDSLAYGGIMITYFPFMIAGYLIIPITLNTLFRGLRSNISLAILAALYSFIYS